MVTTVLLCPSISSDSYFVCCNFIDGIMETGGKQRTPRGPYQAGCLPSALYAIEDGATSAT